MTTILNAPSQIAVPWAPAIPGLSFRRFRGEADYPLMVAILDACNAADRLEFINTVDEVAWVFAHLTNCDPERDMLFAEVDGATIAFSRVWWVAESTGERLYNSLGFVHPDWRRKGLGAAMLRYDEARLLDIARDAPRRGPQVLPRLGLRRRVGARPYSPRPATNRCATTWR